jgi:hypothetical protein
MSLLHEIGHLERGENIDLQQIEEKRLILES